MRAHKQHQHQERLSEIETYFLVHKFQKNVSSIICSELTLLLDLTIAALDNYLILSSPMKSERRSSLLKSVSSPMPTVTIVATYSVVERILPL